MQEQTVIVSDMHGREEKMTLAAYVERYGMDQLPYGIHRLGTKKKPPSQRDKKAKRKRQERSRRKSRY